MRLFQSVAVRPAFFSVPRFLVQGTLPVFALTLFSSALLLFSIQPLFTKMVLPTLGGAPSVWAVAMCFFQAVLLAGYAYAHVLERWLSPVQMIMTHLTVLGLALLVLPISIASGWTSPPSEGTQFWLLGLLGASIGLPFFALSANGPLLQAWFARTGHRHAEDPYFLYGASNVGSLLALLAYPVFLEPNLTLGGQSTLWTAGYMILIMLVAVSAVHMLYHHAPVTSGASRDEAVSEARPSWRTQFVWAGLAFIPSGLLVAVTTHISTDVAAAPFLWVVPLALFLLTFVITFQRRPLLKQRWMLAAQPLLVALLLVLLPFSIHLNWLFSLALNLGAFFITAMVCHGELVRRRPAAGHLTRFYLWMSLGGMLGGVFTSLVAPYAFSTVIEYPLLIVAGLLVRPGFWTTRAKTWWRALLVAAIVFAVLAGPKLLTGYELAERQPLLFYAGLVVLGSIVFLSRQHPVRLVLMATVLALSSHVLQPEITKGENLRGFFGVNKVVTTPDGAFRLLFHGTTLHGAERLAASGTGQNRPEPLTYYHHEGPFADVIRAARRNGPLRRVAAVGLGTGSLACYSRPGENWRFFEIDPIVARIAVDPDRFSFMSTCAPTAPVIIGDARLTLAAEPVTSRYDLMILDAFSSDSIPVHLLTLEAMTGYLHRLNPDGVLLFHISNRHMNLTPVLAAAARALGLYGLVHYPERDYQLMTTFKSDAWVVALARKPQSLALLASDPDWQPLPRPASRPWTDDYSGILSAILTKRPFTRP